MYGDLEAQNSLLQSTQDLLSSFSEPSPVRIIQPKYQLQFGGLIPWAGMNQPSYGLERGEMKK